MDKLSAIIDDWASTPAGSVFMVLFVAALRILVDRWVRAREDKEPAKKRRKPLG